MSLTLFALLLCTPPTHAQTGGYPGGGSGGSSGGYPGGSGYPGGGSGGGPAPDPGHYWKITYSSSGHVNYATLDGFPGFTTPHSRPWDSTSSAAGFQDDTFINGDVLCTVTATLTWVPAAGKSPQSDPPSKMVSIEEYGNAEESPGNWNCFGPAPVPAGSASDGLGDAPVAWNSGYISTGTHRVRKDGTSGTITLGPFTLTAACPASIYTISSGEGPLAWDWTGGCCAAGFSVAVDPPAYPINLRQINVSKTGDGNLEFTYTWDSSVSGMDHTDLADWRICEIVTYAGNPVGKGLGFFGNDQNGIYSYFPPDPFDGHHQEPSQLSVPATDNIFLDDQLHFPFSRPYKEASYTGVQKFYALNGTTGETISMLGPFTITRSVENTICTPEGDYYMYTITKNGAEADLDLGLEAGL